MILSRSQVKLILVMALANQDSILILQKMLDHDTRNK